MSAVEARLWLALMLWLIVAGIWLWTRDKTRQAITEALDRPIDYVPFYGADPFVTDADEPTIQKCMDVLACIQHELDFEASDGAA